MKILYSHIPWCYVHMCSGADVNRRTTNNDHTVLSLASAGGHVGVVQFLLSRGAEPSHMLRVKALWTCWSKVDVKSLCMWYCFRTTRQC